MYVPIKNRSNDIDCLKSKDLFYVYSNYKNLEFYIAQSKSNKTLSFKKNDAIHYVTYVTFCITIQFLINYACRFFWNVYNCLLGLVFDVALKAINWPIQNCKDQPPIFYRIYFVGIWK